MFDIIGILGLAVRVYVYVLIARILLSWFPLPDNPTLKSIWNVVYDLTEPYLNIFRRFIPPLGAGGMAIDLSPIIAILVLQLGWSFVSSLLASILG